MKRHLFLLTTLLIGLNSSAQVGINQTFISDFQEWTDNWTSANGTNMPLSKAENPQNGGVNTSSNVMKVEKNSSANIYDGVFRNVSGITIGTGTNDHRYFRMKLKAANTTDVIRFKVRATDNTEYGVDYTPTTTDWIEIAIDMTQAVIAGSTTKIPEGTELNRVLINPRAAGTVYFDDIFLSDEESDVTYYLTIGEAGAATLVLPFESKVPAGVNVVAVKNALKEGNVIDTYNLANSEGVITRNNVGLVIGAPGTYAFKANKTNFNAYSKTMSTSGMTGVYTETTVPAGSYILSIKDGVAGFYKADGTTNKVTRFHAYLTLAGASPARVSLGFDDETTGIKSVNNGQWTMDNSPFELGSLATKGTQECFDLQGRRVAHPDNGLYIINGKKIIVK